MSEENKPTPTTTKEKLGDVAEKIGETTQHIKDALTPTPKPKTFGENVGEYTDSFVNTMSDAKDYVSESLGITKKEKPLLEELKDKYNEGKDNIKSQ